MSKSNGLWNKYKVNNHPHQFFAMSVVIRHLQCYSTYELHKQRILNILKGKQK